VVARGRPPMSATRTEILSRIRSALADAPERESPQLTRDYERGRRDGRRLEQLAQQLTDYRARVVRAGAQEIGEAVARVCAQEGLLQLVVASGLPADWRPHGIELIDERAVGDRELDSLDGVLTGCAVAVAETGTIVLDGGPLSGRRAITLVPDHHICVVYEDQVVALVPEAFARIEPAVLERRAPVTLISGPSATSDIELNRVEGVHGPRTLIVLLVA
jgi:L-lactate dehydrogenase complex protein LldG